MNVEAKPETLGFQTEVKELLQLMIHSLYSNKEIFLRELISNASDAMNKLRFEALSNEGLYEGDSELAVHIEFDKDNRTITVRDNGIGMSRDTVIKQLGTIAKSGTRDFLHSLTGDQSKDTQLIGQFGVGFYSSFIVSEKVTVRTRQAGMNEAVQWESYGDGEFTVENISKETRGTEIILHLKEGEDEFLEDWRLRTLITRYSDHISFPVLMKKIQSDDKNEEQDVFEPVNRAKAIWTLPKKDITDEEYRELYKYIAHDMEAPLSWSHNRVEGKQQYISLLYLPSQVPMELQWNRDFKHGLKLYVNRVFIMDDAEVFLPNYLRFVKGVIDSSDLPLNVSREILQNNALVDSIRSGVVKKILDMIENLASDEPDLFEKFIMQFGTILKEGIVEDFVNRDRIAKLLRFVSTKNNSSELKVSLTDYVSGMNEGQKAIYYLTAETYAAAKNSPHLEVFEKNGLEVLLLTDPIDEWLVGHLTEFDGRPLQSVARGDVDLGGVEENEEKEQQTKRDDEFSSVLEHVKKILGEKIKEARTTNRLVNSPACLVVDENEMGSQMQRILKAAGQDIAATKPIFELNPEHPIIQRLRDEQDDDRFSDWANILFDQALIAEGGKLDDPGSYVKRLNNLLLELA